ncbi:MAG: fumarylacetoacetate hydrolase family protein [Pelomonas sp.]|nr:fumarylacetoacetate hydrolase family protein [Roseateles sp.]
MKLASYSDGSRDGQLVVVSRDLSLAHYATGIATRLQQLLDDWGFISPQLEDLYTQLNHGKLRHAFAFEPQRCLAPLPRASAFAAPDWLPGDAALGPRQAARFADASLGIEGEAGFAAICGDIAVGASAAAGLEGVRLLALMQRWRLREWPDAAPPPAFAPVAVTPDELGAAWTKGRVDLAVQRQRNGRRVDDARIDAGFGAAIARTARARRLGAGTIVGMGAAEAIADTYQFGDSLRVEVRGLDGQTVFGAIEQEVASLRDAAPRETPDEERQKNA